MLSFSRRAAALAAVSLFLLAGATEAKAAYFSVSGLLPVANEATANVGGVLEVEPDLGVGFGLSSAIGTNLLPGVRLELEGSFLAFEGSEADFTLSDNGDIVSTVAPLDSSITVVTWMVNGYYEPTLPLPVKPYIGAGAGFAGIALEASNVTGGLIDDEATVFAFQALAGASLPLAPGSELFGGYRFLLLDTAELTDLFLNPVNVEFQSHMVEVGVRFGF